MSRLDDAYAGGREARLSDRAGRRADAASPPSLLSVSSFLPATSRQSTFSPTSLSCAKTPTTHTSLSHPRMPWVRPPARSGPRPASWWCPAAARRKAAARAAGQMRAKRSTLTSTRSCTQRQDCWARRLSWAQRNLHPSFMAIGPTPCALRAVRLCSFPRLSTGAAREPRMYYRLLAMREPFYELCCTRSPLRQGQGQERSTSSERCPLASVGKASETADLSHCEGGLFSGLVPPAFLNLL